MEDLLLLYKEIFSPIKNSFIESENWQKQNKILDSFLDELWLQKNKKTRYIAYERIANLKPTPLQQYLESTKNSINQNIKALKVEIPNKLNDTDYILDKAYNWVKNLYELYFEKFLKEVEARNLVSSYDLLLLKWTFELVKSFNIFAFKRLNHIKKQNRILDKMFDYDSSKIMAYLKEKDLLEKDENWNYVDRSYSVIKWGKLLSYAEAFPNEINYIFWKILDFIENLKQVEWPYKQEYIDYLNFLGKAISERNIFKTYKAWQNVDIAWMKIKYYFQIVHPMEYYDDKYRRAVAPEIDIRLKSDNVLKSSISHSIKSMWWKWAKSFLNESESDIFEITNLNLQNIQLYIGEPLIFGWNYLNWLFSAQIVPNDEEVSVKYWKKIFAFPSKVREDILLSPVEKIIKYTLGDDFIDTYFDIVKNEKLFYKIYDVETIWHEFWHALWMGQDTEILMNEKTWNFKNIEEFKATSGGLVSYFESIKNKELENIDFLKSMLVIHIFRVINLLKYYNTTEILPYYFESLIHLDILYNSGILNISNLKIKVDFDKENILKFIENYTSAYKSLVKLYVAKLDAGNFLSNYVVFENWIWYPKNSILYSFVKEIIKKF